MTGPGHRGSVTACQGRDCEREAQSDSVAGRRSAGRRRSRSSGFVAACRRDWPGPSGGRRPQLGPGAAGGDAAVALSAAADSDSDHAFTRRTGPGAVTVTVTVPVNTEPGQVPAGQQQGLAVTYGNLNRVRHRSPAPGPGGP